MLINKGESTDLKCLNNSRALIDIYKNIEDYNPNKKREILIVFDVVIADMVSKKSLNPV